MNSDKIMSYQNIHLRSDRLNQVQPIEPSYPQISFPSDAGSYSNGDQFKPSFISKSANSLGFKSQGKILVCDDEKFNQNIIFGFLMILGVHNRSELCEFVENGEDAFEKIRTTV